MLLIDLETFSNIDLKKCGAYRYVQDPSFRVLLFGYAYDNEPVKVIDLAQGEELPSQLHTDIFDYGIKKIAFNAAFERTCLARYFKEPIFADQWQDIMIQALELGLPGNLDKCGEVLGLEIQKDKIGKSLITYFCKPCKPTKANGEHIRNLPAHDPEKWELFKSYCITDVETERQAMIKMAKYPLVESEQQLWELDQKINDRGVMIHRKLMENAIKCANQYNARLMSEALELTGLENPNSVSQLKGWLLEAEGLDVEKLNKAAMPGLIETVGSDRGRRVLEIRQELAKSSVKKYEAMQRSIGTDDRVRGLLQFYGASRTGRWAGRLIQVQNLPQNHMKELELARNMLIVGDFDGIEMLFDSIPQVLSELIRTALIPKPGHHFIAVDFSAIEARVLAWMAGEEWVLDVFRGDGKIYEATAANMFKIPYNTIVKGHENYEYRQKGKVATLACGYQGGVGALKAFGALNMGLEEKELQPLIDAWREANPNIVRLWARMNSAAMKAIKSRVRVPVAHGVEFIIESGILFMRLPSGRRLAYATPGAEVAETKGGWKKEGIYYYGYEEGHWQKIRTYGGKFTENLIQAAARDVMAEAMMRLNKSGYRILLSVHDEVVMEVPNGQGSVKEIIDLMCQIPKWAEGLPLNAAGEDLNFYQK